MEAAANEPRMTLEQARDRWFGERDLPSDGGYQEKWVKLKMGPIPFAIPNTKTRKEAVPLHDLHHLLTGYQTDWTGEFEISAWEIAAGCGRYSFAWMINLQGLIAGAVVFPRRTWRAWVRGRRSKTLYNHAEYGPELLASNVEEWQAKLSLVGSKHDPRVMDLALYMVAVAIGAATTLGPIALLGAACWYAVSALLG